MCGCDLSVCRQALLEPLCVVEPLPAALKRLLQRRAGLWCSPPVDWARWEKQVLQKKKDQLALS